MYNYGANNDWSLESRMYICPNNIYKAKLKGHIYVQSNTEDK